MPLSVQRWSQMFCSRKEYTGAPGPIETDGAVCLCSVFLAVGYGPNVVVAWGEYRVTVSLNICFVYKMRLNKC